MPGEPPSLTEKPGRPQSTELQRVRHNQSDLVRIDPRLFLPVAALPQSELRVKVVQLLGLWGLWWYQAGTQTASAAECYGSIRVFFQASCSCQSEGLWPVFLCSSTHAGTSRAPLPGVLLCCSMGQGHRGVPLAGVLVCRSARQALKGAPWVGSCSAVQCIRRLMGQCLCCSAADAGVWGERGYGDGSTSYT